MLETLIWHCCLCCNPANVMGDIEERLDHKTQLHCLAGNESLSVDWDQCPTKQWLASIKMGNTFLKLTTLNWFFQFHSGLLFSSLPFVWLAPATSCSSWSAAKSALTSCNRRASSTSHSCPKSSSLLRRKFRQEFFSSTSVWQELSSSGVTTPDLSAFWVSTFSLTKFDLWRYGCLICF